MLFALSGISFNFLGLSLRERGEIWESFCLDSFEQTDMLAAC